MARKPTPDVLDALFTSDAGGPVQVDLDLIDDNPYQPRQIYDPDRIAELASSIEREGLLQTPGGRWVDGRVQLVWGHRRKRAFDVLRAKDPRWASMPVQIVNASDEDMAARAWAENHERDDLTAVEQAEAINTMVTRFGWTQARVAERLGLSPATVNNKLRLLRAPVEVKAAVVQGEMSERQAGALAPLWDLPQEAAKQLTPYSNLPSMIQRARDGASSDELRRHVSSAVFAATKAVPEHWSGFDFGALDGIEQSKCPGCPYLIRHADTDRCKLPSCWDAKSSMWQAIEHAQIVKITGVEILPEDCRYDDRTELYSQQRQLLGLPMVADQRPADVCPNLRIRKGYRESWDWVCYHPGKKGGCACVARAQKEAAKDGRAAWKQMRAETDQALADHIAGFPVDALRLLARQYGKWEQRDQVPGWTAEECVPVVVSGLIKAYMPYDAEKNSDVARSEMTKLLTIAGVRAPWLPPLEEEIAEKLGAARAWLDDYLDPGDGTPTPAAMTAFLDDLRGLADTISQRVAEDQRQRLMQRQIDLWFEALALQDRIQRSYELMPENDKETDHA